MAPKDAHESGAGDGALVVITTAGDGETARRIAAVLVENRLAACVNILSGVNSIYRWRGETVDEGEFLLVIKTWSDRFDDLKRRIVAEHTYEVPEVVARSIESGHAPYLEWVLKETRSSGAPPAGKDTQKS